MTKCSKFNCPTTLWAHTHQRWFSSPLIAILEQPKILCSMTLLYMQGLSLFSVSVNGTQQTLLHWPVIVYKVSKLSFFG